VTSAAYYGPRRDFDPVTLACKGLLVEEQRTNLVRYSRTLETTGSYWSNLTSGTANTITIDNAPGPDGLSTSASMITYNTAVTGAGTYSAWRHSLTTTANGTYTFSVWLKAGTNTSVYIRLNDSGGNRANTLCTLTSSWQRFTVTGTTAASITTISCDVGADGNVGGQTMTAGTVYAYGAQLEANASFATSYVPNGSTVNGTTRTADVASVSTQAFPYSATEGALIISATTISTTATTGRYAGLYNATDRMIDLYGVSTQYANYKTSDAQQTNFGTWQQSSKIGVVYKVDDYAFVANGTTVVTDTSTSGLTAANQLNLGHYNSSSQLNGHIRQITYLPRRISNAELQTRTA
jgi:hypothetical protein